jgi:outer membrane protein
VKPRFAIALLCAFTPALALAQPAPAPAPAPGPRPTTLTLAQALSRTDANPDVRAARGGVQAAVARADAAKAPLLPRVEADASYGIGGSSIGDRIADPDGALRAGVSASVLVWDFGRTAAQRRAAVAGAESATYGGEQTELDVRLGVRVAFFRARAAKELVRVAAEALANEQRHLEQITAFVEIGNRPDIDVFQARTAVANARVALIRAEADYAASRAELNQAMGIEGETGYDVADESMPPIDGEERSSAELLAAAARARPELAALAADRRAQELSVDAARKARWPSLRATAGVDGTVAGPSDAADDRFWGWSAGLSLSMPLFDGGEISARVREAEAQLVVLDARRDGSRQALLVELEQALLAVRSSKAEVSATEEAAANARERLRLAEGRYGEGVGTAIELGDAQVEVTRAAAQAVQARYALATARAQLLHALGRS